MAFSFKKFVATPTLDALRRAVEDAFESFVRQSQEQTSIDLRPIHVEPTKVVDGMIVFADGVDWNPGGGRGVYVRDSGNWVKL